jgi:hypothetical protein
MNIVDSIEVAGRRRHWTARNPQQGLENRGSTSRTWCLALKLLFRGNEAQKRRLGQLSGTYCIYVRYRASAEESSSREDGAVKRLI